MVASGGEKNTWGRSQRAHGAPGWDSGERASERASTERAAAAHSGRAQRAVRRTKGNSERSPRRKGTGHKSGGGGGRDRVLFC